MISSTALRYTYDGATEIRMKGFRLGPGEALLVTGPNGVGKSTFLKLCAGLLSPLEGEVSFSHPGISPSRQISYLGPAGGLELQARVFEALQFSADMANKGATCSHEAAQVFGAWDFRHKHVRGLSQGQKMRVMLAKLLIEARRIWVLDEPLAALDQQGIQVFLEKLAEHCQGGGCVLMAAHEPQLANKIKNLGVKAFPYDMQASGENIWLSQGFMPPKVGRGK